MPIHHPDLKHVSKHHQYYLHGGDLHLLVENTLFRVHSYFFERDSASFRSKLGHCSSVPRVGTEDSPICISGATPAEFAIFLWTIYNETYDLYHASIDEWKIILKIATDLEFVEATHFAIRGLERCDLSLAHRIQLYQTYNVDPVYLIPLFVKMCMREDGPSDDESELIGAKTTLMIFRARERLRGGRITFPSNVDEVAATQAICTALGYDGVPPAPPPVGSAAFNKGSGGSGFKPNGANADGNKKKANSSKFGGGFD